MMGVYLEVLSKYDSILIKDKKTICMKRELKETIV